MIFLIRFVQNAVDIYSPIVAPLQRLPLQIAGLDLSVWIAVLLVHFLGEQLIRLLVIFL